MEGDPFYHSSSQVEIAWAKASVPFLLSRDLAALTMAIWRRGHAKQVIVHSDRGVTYASRDYQPLLDRHQLLCSMSRKGECLDNAVVESFFSSLKTELVDHEDYHTKVEAKQSLLECIEIFYTRRRRHS